MNLRFWQYHFKDSREEFRFYFVTMATILSGFFAWLVGAPLPYAIGISLLFELIGIAGLRQLQRQEEDGETETSQDL